LKHYYPEGKCSCGGTVVLESEPDQQHQVFDLPEVRYTVVEHRTHVGCCTGCGKRHKGRLPDDVPVGQMGPGLIAWIGLMNGGNRLSTRALQALLAEQWGLHFSLGAISEAQGKLAEWLEAPHEHIGEVVKMPRRWRTRMKRHALPLFSEQGLERHWLWTLTSGTAVYFSASFSRGKAGGREACWKALSGVLVTDRLGSYRCYPQERRQVCLAHVIRNLTAMSQRKGDAGRLGEAAGALAAAGVPAGAWWRKWPL
jgi:transposase